MILKTKVPGRVVQRRKRKLGGGFKIVPWFKFDDNGLAEIDESTIDAITIQKLKKMFDVVEETVNYADMKYKQLQAAYADKTGNSAVGKSKKDILKELED